MKKLLWLDDMRDPQTGTWLMSYAPDFDEDRVYTSDIKKVIQWYNILVDAGLDFSKIEATATENSEKV